jgi:hypothetical protein
MRAWLVTGAAAATVAAWGLAPPVACALDTLPASQLVQMARPLPKQQEPVDKSKVWAVCVGGAAVLFVGTVVAENNEAWFPAISRANKAMNMSRQAAAAREARERQQKQRR